MIEITTMIEAIQEAKQRRGFISIIDYKASETTENEYCLFIKPELTGINAERFKYVAELIFERIQAFEQTPIAVSAIEASYVVKHNIMAEHYGVIDSISRHGIDVISEGARQRLNEITAEDPNVKLETLGAHQFLDRFPYFSAQALAVFYDNLKNIKLAGGTHCVRAIVRGVPVLLFNGFHPEQLERYTIPGSVILAFVFRTSVPWKILRTNMTGATNPAKALPESIRGALFSQKDRLGLDEVSSGKNGVHVSAGPVEGMVEIMRFMSNLDENRILSPDQTTFGKLLLKNTKDSQQLSYLSGNPNIEGENTQIPVFDFTEEIDAVTALDRLIEVGLLEKRSS